MQTQQISRRQFRWFRNTEQFRLGRANEDRLWKVFQELLCSMEKPEWLKSVRRATKHEDMHLETDFVVETHDIGPMFFNAKSSEYYAEKFNGYRRSRRVIAIPMDAVLAANQQAAEDFILKILWQEYVDIRILRGDSI